MMSRSYKAAMLRRYFNAHGLYEVATLGEWLQNLTEAEKDEIATRTDNDLTTPRK